MEKVVGKFANAQAWREYEAKRDRELDGHLDDEPPLTEAERAAEWDDKHWQRQDASFRDLPRRDWRIGAW